jgi:hypothetical protein
MIVAEEFQKLLSFTVGLFETFGIGQNWLEQLGVTF